jgi:hypothetical protein
LNSSSATRFLIALWGTSGLCYILAKAVARLSPIALEPIMDGSMGILHWSVFVVWVAYMGYAEGWKGFHKRVGPRTASRAFHLAEARPLVHLIFAPIFCMALYHASRRTLIVRWSLVIGIVTLVVLIRLLPQPWRGIIDAGVVVGLAMGLCSVIYFFVRGLAGHVEELKDLPGQVEPQT